MRIGITGIANAGGALELQRTLAELKSAIDRHQELGWTRSDPPVRALVRRMEMTRRSIELQSRERHSGGAIGG